MKSKKIAFFTGTRADYGLLSGLIELFKKDAKYETNILVSGSHLSPKYGETYKEIEADGFSITEKLNILINPETELGNVKNMGIALNSYGEALAKQKPDLVFILGDRYEALCMAMAAYSLKIPVAHLHGGEVTAGALDEGYRHAITKLSYLHFAATIKSKERIIAMGENPKRVFHVGALGVEKAKSISVLSPAEIKNRFGIELQDKNILITYHPATAESNPLEQVKIVLTALSSLSDDVGMYFTGVNADNGREEIEAEIKKFVSQRAHTAFVASFGQLGYMSMVKHVNAVVGNSSSGIIEAPALGTWTINIGNRQQGRESASSVLNVQCNTTDILSALKKVISSEKPKAVSNPYDLGSTSQNIKSVVDQWTWPTELKKEFYESLGKNTSN
jgi:UDP-hydrolysing UDP-N-acetyl-D-glucosamine 2-epimerase